MDTDKGIQHWMSGSPMITKLNELAGAKHPEVVDALGGLNFVRAAELMQQGDYTAEQVAFVRDRAIKQYIAHGNLKGLAQLADR